jgi:hypothetical protein
MERRRRFIPRPEGLEVRELLSTVKAPTAQVRPVTVAAATTPKQPAWVTRIQRLPGFLASINPNRFVPPELIQALQADLLAIATRLKAPPSWALKQFNLQLRATIPHPELRSEDAAGLNNLFGLVLQKSNADPNVVAKFQSDMSELARVDSIQSNPAQTTAGDYGMILQMCMGVGLSRQTAAKPATTPTRTRAR